eukprot:6328089-Pyramimonas_sp.AAC.1
MHVLLCCSKLLPIAHLRVFALTVAPRTLEGRRGIEMTAHNARIARSSSRRRARAPAEQRAALRPPPRSPRWTAHQWRI